MKREGRKIVEGDAPFARQSFDVDSSARDVNNWSTHAIANCACKSGF